MTEEELKTIQARNDAACTCSPPAAFKLCARCSVLPHDLDDVLAELRKARSWKGELDNYRAICELVGCDSVTDRALDDIRDAMVFLDGAGWGAENIDMGVMNLVNERDAHKAESARLTSKWEESMNLTDDCQTRWENALAERDALGVELAKLRAQVAEAAALLLADNMDPATRAAWLKANT